jgi:hypothetical protein
MEVFSYANGDVVLEMVSHKNEVSNIKVIYYFFVIIKV